MQKQEAKPIQLGYLAKCKITGYQGVISLKTEFLHNSPRVALMPQDLDKDGNPKEELSFDQTQIEVISDKPIVEVPAFEPISFYFGQSVQDNMSGLSGRVYGIAYYLNGCVRIGIQPAVSEKAINKLPEVEWIPQGALVSLEPETKTAAEKKKASQKQAKTGGPMSDAPRSIGR